MKLRRSVNFFCGIRTLRLQNVFVRGFRIITLAFFLNDLQSSSRTNIKARPHPVTKDLFRKHRFLLLIKHQRPFRAGRGTQTTTVALFPVDLDDLTLGHSSPR